MSSMLLTDADKVANLAEVIEAAERAFSMRLNEKGRVEEISNFVTSTHIAIDLLNVTACEACKQTTKTTSTH